MRVALSPMAARCGVDYDESASVPPESESATAFEALRACSSLLMAFAYEDAWPGGDRKARKSGKRGAALVRGSFSTDSGRDAISWITQQYGLVLAAMRRRAAQESPERAEPMQATAEVDEWLAGLVEKAWPVEGHDDELGFARQHNQSRSYDIDNPDAMVDLHAHADRVRATVEMLSVAMGPAAEEIIPALTPWTYMFDITFAQALALDWRHVGEHWANLIQPERRSYIDVAGDREA